MSDCIFCKIINGDIPSQKVYEDDLMLAFKDIEPQAPVHLILIPKKHISSSNDINSENISYISHIFTKVPQIAASAGIDKEGYRIVNNCGESAGQTVKHIHFHMMGGRSFGWPAG